jgi:hypothetical protein
VVSEILTRKIYLPVFWLFFGAGDFKPTCRHGLDPNGNVTRLSDARLEPIGINKTVSLFPVLRLIILPSSSTGASSKG